MAVKTAILPPRYRGPEQIGRGGMGDIYRATDSVLGRVVAIKILADRYAHDESVRERFTREALSAARLSGEPNTVTIYDVGEHGDRPYIVMEYLGGGSLDDVLRSGGAASPERVFTWLEEAGRALDAAHREGVVHRDVKPANLMLDGEGHVHVADFGIASSAGMDSLTMTGTVLGTAGYFSPEQAQGDRAGAASDRYALAIVAWELLTGKRPFESESPTAEAAAHVNAPVPAISAGGNLPRELDRIFEQALAKDPSQRYGSSGEFVAALRSGFSDAAGSTSQIPAVALPPTPATQPQVEAAKYVPYPSPAHPSRRTPTTTSPSRASNSGTATGYSRFSTAPSRFRASARRSTAYGGRHRATASDLAEAPGVLLVVVLPESAGALDRLPPVAVVAVPVDRGTYALAPVTPRLPAECANFRRLERIAPVVAGAVLDASHE